MIKLDDVRFSLPTGPVIDGASLHLERGKMAALAGGNGAGKSTLLKLIMGLYRPTSGQIFVDGEDTRGKRVSDLARKVGFLFQNPDRQIFGSTVREELAFGAERLGVPRDEVESRVDETIGRFGFGANSPPVSLSRGERQRLALAGLFLRKPRLLLLDEPTTGLDYRECMQMMNAVAELNRSEGVTVLMVTHDMEIALDFAPRMLVLADGKIAADGPTRELMRDAKLMNRAFLMPAQMVALASRLGIPPGEADDAESMAEWVAVRAGKGGGV